MTQTAAVHPAIAGDAPWQRATVEYVERLRAHYGERLVTVVLYGSRARGDNYAESDVDLLIVLAGEFDDKSEQDAVWNLREGVDDTYGVWVMLCPVVAREAEYRHRMLPFLMNVRREGLELWPLKSMGIREEREAYGRSQREEVLAILAKSRRVLRQANQAFDWEMFDLVIVRSYYAMFHAATGLLLSDGLAFSRHSAVIGAFRQQWVNAGRFRTDLAQSLQPAFDLRHEADYEYHDDITEEQARELLNAAKAFVAEADRILSSPAAE